MQYNLKNFMEDLVFDYIDKNIDTFGCCKCEKCRNDIAAYALNNLHPKYVVTEAGKVYSRVDAMDIQFGVDIYKEVENAAELIRQRPHH